MAKSKSSAKRTNLKGAAKKSPTEARPLVVRSRDMLRGPIGELGFAHLITPDEAFGQVKFKAAVHYGDLQRGQLFDLINEAYWALVPELMDQAKEAGKDKLVKVLSKADLLAYLNEKVKQPSESARIQVPYFNFDCNASYKNKDGEEVPVSVKAYDPHGAPVDLKGLRLGMGSMVKPIFTVGVWAGSSPFSKWAALPTLRFVGLQVIKLKQFGGSGQQTMTEVSASELDALGLDADDLSQFLAKPEAKKAAAAGDDMEDDLPF